MNNLVFMTSTAVSVKSHRIKLKYRTLAIVLIRISVTKTTKK